jgi:hypothetical protein
LFIEGILFLFLHAEGEHPLDNFNICPSLEREGLMKKILLLLFPSFSEFEITVATAVLRSKYELVTVALENESESNYWGVRQ